MPDPASPPPDLDRARLLLAQTDLSPDRVAALSGYRTVGGLRRALARAGAPSLEGVRRARILPPASVALRLPRPRPWAAAWSFGYLAERALPGLERAGQDHFARWLTDPRGGPFEVEVRDAPPEHLEIRIPAAGLGRLSELLDRIEALLDVHRDLDAVDAVLGADPVLGALGGAVRRGTRVPRALEPFELAVRAVLGQQVSVAGARTLATRLVERHGIGIGPGLRRFPEPDAVGRLDPARLGVPSARGRALVGLARAASSTPDLFEGPPDAVRRRLLEVPGIGPWTAEYVAMRALGDPDAFLSTDLVVARAWRVLAARAGDGRALPEAAEAWRPYRAYAVQWLWRWWLGLPAAERRALAR